jgi:hypothetical protein
MFVCAGGARNLCRLNSLYTFYLKAHDMPQHKFTICPVGGQQLKLYTQEQIRRSENCGHRIKACFLIKKKLEWP